MFIPLLSHPRTIRRGWTCGSWRLNSAGVTSPMRVMTPAGKCLPVNTLCLTLLTSCPLLLRRPPTTRRAGRTQTCRASLRGSASSDRRETEDLFRKEGEGGLRWSARSLKHLRARNKCSFSPLARGHQNFPSDHSPLFHDGSLLNFTSSFTDGIRVKL